MPKPTRTLPKKDRKCIGCGRRPPWSVKSKYCQDCSKIYRRMRNKGYSPEAQQGVWAYIHQEDFTCYLTKMELELNDSKSARYLVFDHCVPGDPHNILPTSALVNTMKSDMLREEFFDAVFQIADHIRLGTPVNIKEPVHWYRLFLKSQMSD